MTLYTDTDAAPTHIKDDVIHAMPTRMKSAVVDTRYTPQNDLIAYIDGSSWIVDYYSQVLDVADELGGQDTASPAPLKQYRRIWSMELKVMQDLSQPTQDTGPNEWMAQGNANVYPFLVPQIGDMFRAGIADGREGIFKVIRVDPRQLFTDKVHVIEYQLIATDDPARIYDLEHKTVATYYFVKDFLLNLQNPLLTEADFHASKQLELAYYDMARLYFTQYFSRETKTLIVPNQLQYTYDHGLTDFVKMIMDSYDDMHVQSIRQMNIGDDGAMLAPSLWTMLEQRNPKLLKFVYTKTGLVGRYTFHNSGMMAGMRYSGIERIVYPLNAKRNVDYAHFKEHEKTLMADNIVSTMRPVPLEPPVEGVIGVMPAIWPIAMDKSYVLSDAFYTRSYPQCSLLEKLLLDYLDSKTIPASDVARLCDASYEWGDVEKFYYVPLLLLLIRFNLRRL